MKFTSLNCRQFSFALILSLALISFASHLSAFNDNLLEWTHPYYKVLRKSTQSDVKYEINDLDARYRVFATFHSKKFKQAYEKYFNRYYPEGQPGKAGEAHNAQSGDFQTELFVALYAKEKSLRELKNPEGLWSIQLQVGNQIYEPILLEEVPKNAYYKKFYPYLKNWYRGYRIVFPYDAYQSQEPMTLVLRSIAGISRLKFKP